jgi:hypothetical protein
MGSAILNQKPRLWQQPCHLLAGVGLSLLFSENVSLKHIGD